MSIKLNITNEEHAALSDELKPLYVADGDNFKLAVDGLEDTGALKRAKDREAQNAKEAKDERDRIAAELQEIKDKLAEGDMTDKRKKGDIEALEKSWKEKRDNDVKAEQEKAERLKRQMETLLVGNVANQIATELFTAPEPMRAFLERRLKAEFEGDTPVTRVLDANGNPSAASIDDFKKELLATESLKGILVASKASGGGAGNGGGSGAGGSTKKLTDMSDAERIELFKTNPTVFNQLVEQSKG